MQETEPLQRRSTGGSSRRLDARGRLPDVDPRVSRVAVDALQFILTERKVARGRHGVLELPNASRADQRGRNAFVAKHPSDRHLRKRLPALASEVIERSDMGEILI